MGLDLKRKIAQPDSLLATMLISLFWLLLLLKTPSLNTGIYWGQWEKLSLSEVDALSLQMSKVGWGSEKPYLGDGIPAHSGGLDLDNF